MVVVVAGVVAQLRALRSGTPLAESCLFLLLVIVVVVVAVVVVVVHPKPPTMRATLTVAPNSNICVITA